MNFRDGTKKMSKSDPSAYSRIEISDSNDDIASKVKKAKTDRCDHRGSLPNQNNSLFQSYGTITIDELSRPEITNMIRLFSEMAKQSPERICEQFEQKTTAEFKQALSEQIVAYISPLRESFFRFLADPAELDRILLQGADRANMIAIETLGHVHRAVGLTSAPSASTTNSTCTNIRR